MLGDRPWLGPPCALKCSLHGYRWRLGNSAKVPLQSFLGNPKFPLKGSVKGDIDIDVCIYIYLRAIQSRVLNCRPPKQISICRTAEAQKAAAFMLSVLE